MPSFCEVALPITWAKGDTPETIKQIREANAVFDELCRNPEKETP